MFGARGGTVFKQQLRKINPFIFTSIMLVVTVISMIGYLSVSLTSFMLHDAQEEAILLAHRYSKSVEEIFNKAVYSAKVIAFDLESDIKFSSPSREKTNEVLINSLKINNDFLAVWACFEPNAFDGKDSFYINKPGHDQTGRYIPYFNRLEENSITLIPVKNYEDHVKGIFYLLPKKIKKAVITEPYYYFLNNQEIRMISICIPVFGKNDEFIGVVGLDYDLTNLETFVNNIVPNNKGWVVLLSNSGTIVAHPDKARVGKNTQEFGDKIFREKVAGFIKKGEVFSGIENDQERKTKVIKVNVPVKISYIEAPWALSVSFLLSNIFSKRNTFLENNIVLGFFLLIIGMGFSFIINKLGGKQLKLEKNIIENEAKFSTIFYKSSTSMSISSIEGGNFFDINEAFTTIYGWTREELIGKSSLEVGIWADAASREKIVSHLKSAGFVKDELVKLRSKSGILHDVLFSAEKIVVGNQELLLSTAYDITEFKKVQDILTENERKYRSIFENSQVGIFRSSVKDGELLICNDHLAHMLGYDNAKVILDEKYLLSQHYQDIQDRIKMLKYFENNRLERYEVELIRKDLQKITVLFSATLFSELGYLEGIVVDITERKNIENILKEKTEELDKFFSLALDLLCIADTQGNFRKLNKQWEEVLGIDISQLENKKFLDFVHPDDLNSTLEVVSQLAAKKQVLNFVNRYRHQDGSYRWIEWKSVPSPEGNKIYAAARDITARKKMEDDLAIEKKRAQNYLDVAAVMIVIIEKDQKVSLINQKGCEILNCKPEDVIGKNWFDNFIPADAREQVKEVFSKLMDINNTQTFEYFENSIITLDGQKKIVAWHNVILKDDNGYPKEILSSGEDITQKRQIEDQLKKLSQAVEQSPSIVVITDLDGNLEYANPKFSEITGYSFEETAQKNMRIFKSGYQDQAFYVKMWEILLQNKTWHGEFYNKKKDGTFYWEDAYIRALKDNQGVITHFVKVSEDVTDRKNIEVSLIASEAKFRAIFENAVEGIYQTTLEGKYINLNPAFAMMFGYDNAQDMINTVTDIGQEIYVNPQDREKLKSLLIKQNEVKNFEVQLYKKDKTKIWVSINVHTVTDDQGRILYFEGTNTEITARKHLEEEREKLLKELSFMNKELESIVYVTSHDLRSPLINILGFTENLNKMCQEIVPVLKDEKIPEDFRMRADSLVAKKIPTALSYIQVSGNKMSLLINGLLELSRTGRVALNIEEIDMNILIESILKTLTFQLQNVQAKVEVDVSLPSCFGDKSKLNQVFSNLLDNAIKYCDSDRLLKIKIAGKLQGNDVVYSVSDNGKGVAKDYQNKIWELFYRLDSQNVIEGEGVGLTVVKRIIERHNGKIWIESEAGIGSTFYIQIPLKK